MAASVLGGGTRGSLLFLKACERRTIAGAAIGLAASDSGERGGVGRVVTGIPFDTRASANAIPVSTEFCCGCLSEAAIGKYKCTKVRPVVSGF